ncbi:MAG TPA: hypothetical protein VGI12_22545 [Vicinamibacterales bacterium]|jgi:hypothetical protein
MLSAMTWTLALTMGLVPRSEPLSAAAVLEAPTRHVRATGHTVPGLLRTGFTQSRTFAALLQRLERSDVIVYIEDVPRLPGALDGRLLIQPAAHGVRYLRIQVALHGSPFDSIATIGHELRHAVEVANASTVVDEQGLADLYRRIGMDYGNNLFDTIEAQEIGRQVGRELQHT